MQPVLHLQFLLMCDSFKLRTVMTFEVEKHFGMEKHIALTTVGFVVLKPPKRFGTAPGRHCYNLNPFQIL